jgi:hypothetical protein
MAVALTGSMGMLVLRTAVVMVMRVIMLVLVAVVLMVFGQLVGVVTMQVFIWVFHAAPVVVWVW